jgi:hypothetical protein
MPNQSARFSSATGTYTRTGLSVGTTFTVLCWARLVVDRSAYMTLWNLDSGSSTTAVALQMAQGSTSLHFTSEGGSDPEIRVMTVGTWYCVAVTRSALSGAGAVKAYQGTSPDALTTVNYTPDGQWGRASFSRLLLSGSAWANNEWINGNLAAVKLYTRALDPSEVATELSYYNPVSTTGLYAAYPFWDGPSLVDASGGGRDLTGGTGTTAEAGPGIPLAPGAVGPEPGRRLLLAR